MEATLHCERPWTSRLDVLVPVALLSVFLHQLLLVPVHDIANYGIMGLAVLSAAVVLLAPIYSMFAFEKLRLSAPMADASAATTVVFSDVKKKKRVVRPLQFRTEGKENTGSVMARVEYESTFYEAPLDSFNGNTRRIVLTPITYPIELPLRDYIERVTGKDTRNAKELLKVYSPNRFDIPLPPLKKLVLEQAQSPFFLFQIFCVLLWMLDEYWYFALFTFFMLLIFEVVVAQNRLRNIESARQMLRPDVYVFVKRAGSWRKILSSEVVPLDVIAVCKDAENPFPCDAMLVTGSAIVNEAMLTGESTPKIKESAISDGDVDLSKPLSTSLEESRFVILGGTTVLEARKEENGNNTLESTIHGPEPGCAVAVVLRTGYGTTQGSLMRVILHAGERVTVDSNREAYAFMMCLVVVAMFAAAYVLNEGLKDPDRSHWKLFLHCIMIVTSVVPPELPMELSLAVTTSLSNLITKHAIYCTEPYRIPLAGMLDVCCFDKTGTLTSDDLSVVKLLDETFAEREDNRSAKEIMAACQSLVLLGGRISGDTTEVAAWRHVSGNFRVVHDPSHVGVSHLVSADGYEYFILTKFAFDASLRRMSVICAKHLRGDINSQQHRQILTKGAPESVEGLLKKVPEGYTEAYESLAKQGFRVLALAKKEIPLKTPVTLSRSQAESDLEFVGFVAFDSPLKADSVSTIKQLQKSGHRVVIITGDSEPTAVEVARKLGIDHAGEAMTGARLQTLLDDPEALKREIIKTSVFARVSPSQKEQIVATMCSAGLVTLMCGDGTNDTGALKRADVGVSVISHPVLERVMREEKGLSLEELMESGNAQIKLGDASIASPFTSKSPQVSCVIDIVRQGRCTLVTTVQMFKILAVNGLVHSITMTVLYLRGVRQGEIQSTIFGILVALMFAMLSFTQPEAKLTDRRPVSRIFSSPVVVAIAGQSLAHLITLFSMCNLIDDSMVKPRHPDDPFEPNAINSVVYLSGMVIQANIFLVNYRGHPFMTPLSANKIFVRTLLAMYGLALLLVLGLMPEFLNSMFELVPLDSIRLNILGYMVLDTAMVVALEYFIRDYLQG